MLSSHQKYAGAVTSICEHLEGNYVKDGIYFNSLQLEIGIVKGKGT
jgi:hypothetical protein